MLWRKVGGLNHALLGWRGLTALSVIATSAFRLAFETKAADGHNTKGRLTTFDLPEGVGFELAVLPVQEQLPANDLER